MSKGKIVILSAIEKDGGAPMWYFNLARILYQDGYEVAYVVKDKTSSEPFVYQVPRLQRDPFVKRWCKKIFRKKERDIYFEATPKYAFLPSGIEQSKAYPPESISSAVPFTPDVVISALTYDFVNTTTLAALQRKWNAKVFLGAYDMNAFTGGCHMIWGCQDFLTGCKNCPAVTEKVRKDEVRESFKIKKSNVERYGIGVMYSTPWQTPFIKNSPIFKNAPVFWSGMSIDTDLYSDRNRNLAKLIFGLPDNLRTIFCGSQNMNDERKGVKHFIDALHHLDRMLSGDVLFCVMLVGRDNSTFNQFTSDLKHFTFHCIDFISDERLLSLAYQAADIFICPSIEDAGPMMVAQALACGTPVVGFRTGLMSDDSYVVNGKTGWVSEIGDCSDMATGLHTILSLPEDKYSAMSEACRKIAVETLSGSYTLKQFEKLLAE